jgi:hypothetical protein
VKSSYFATMQIGLGLATNLLFMKIHEQQQQKNKKNDLNNPRFVFE